MKVPRRITDLINRKQEFIDASRDKLEMSVIKTQSQLMDKLIEEIIPSLDVEAGVIKDTVHNYRILSQLDSVYSKFTKESVKKLAGEVSGAADKIITLGNAYFTSVLTESLKGTFENIIANTAKKISLRIGLEGGKIVSGGFLESLFKNSALIGDIKNYVSKSVTSQVDVKDFIKGLSTIVTGGEKPGAMEKQYQRYAYDLYQQYDRAYNTSLADQLGFSYFLYQGGLVGDSRDFCITHNNKVWTREEAATFAEWVPIDGEYTEAYPMQSKSPYEVPSYLGYPGYDPFIDLGGYRCRHSISWIPDELAFDLRPDLKSIKK